MLLLFSHAHEAERTMGPGVGSSEAHDAQVHRWDRINGPFSLRSLSLSNRRGSGHIRKKANIILWLSDGTKSSKVRTMPSVTVAGPGRSTNCPFRFRGVCKTQILCRFYMCVGSGSKDLDEALTPEENLGCISRVALGCQCTGLATRPYIFVNFLRNVKAT